MNSPKNIMFPAHSPENNLSTDAKDVLDILMQDKLGVNDGAYL